MRNALLLALLVPFVALAVPNLHPVSTMPDERPVADDVPVNPLDGPRAPEKPYVLVGTVDTIGGTTYDWQSNACAYRMVVNSPEYGVHVTWMASASTETTFPDRNMRYNFYDYTTGAWNWIDPDFMQSGVNSFTERCGYGNLDADPSTGVAIIPAHLHTPLTPDVARDMAPGAGLFEYCEGAPNMEAYLWPPLSVGQTGKIHVACIDDASRLALFYSKVDPWCTWANPVGMAAPQPDPEFSNQNIAASKVSEKVCVTWEYSAGSPDPGFYRISTDGGSSWGSPEELPWPDAFGGDTLTSYHITSLFPYYDADDELHIAANVMPFVDGTGYIIPAQLWHWGENQSPQWNHITTATCDPANLGAAVGYNAMYACRPSLGSDAAGNLYVAWEQFDSSNVEPGPPEFLRADIFYAKSTDHGVTWGEPMKITEGGTGSHRFPSIIDMAATMTDEQKLAIVYEIDQQAGFFVQGEGPATNNPMICHWVPIDSSAIAEPGRGAMPARLELAANPNPFGGRTQISYALPQAGDVSVEIFDASGRPVRTLVNRRSSAGRYTVSWDGCDAAGDLVAAGIYFSKLRAAGSVLSEKLTVVR